MGSTCKTLFFNTNCCMSKLTEATLSYKVIPYNTPNPLDVFSDSILRGQVTIIDVTEE